MRIDLCKSLIGLAVLGGLFQFDCSSSVFAQVAKPSRKVGIVSVSAWSQATVQIEVRAAENALVIPYCKETGTEKNLLYCNQGLEHGMEHFDGKKWIRTMPGYPGEVFGVEVGAWKPVVIPPGGSITFEYRFNPEFFHLRRGEKLRLVIHAWESQESLANSEKPFSEFVSPTFNCP